jgi:putative heme d1 biosynthesis radical SAM protein NirJ2
MGELCLYYKSNFSRCILRDVYREDGAPHSLSYAQKGRVEMLISWNVTRQCNLSCIHCYRDARGVRDPDELTLKEGLRLLQEVKEAGFRVVVFSGGEPILRRDLYELITFSKDLGLTPVLGTNGTLIDMGVARRLKSCGLERVGVSLDSIQAEHHDGFRAKPGSFDATLRGIDACKEVGLPFQIHTTVMDFNLDEILEISRFAKDIGASAHHVFFIVPTGRARNVVTDIDKDRYEDVLTQILRAQDKLGLEIKPTCAPQFVRIVKRLGVKSRFMKGCLAGVGYACVLPNGDVWPCPYLPIKCGNIRERGFLTIWQESPIFHRLRDGVYHGRCGRCGFRTTCGGCRARAYHSTGDLMGEDTWCGYNTSGGEV